MIGFKPRHDSLLELEGRAWVEWWLVFTSTDYGHWWNRYLDPGFLHVSALRISRDRWIHVEPAMDYCRVETLDAPIYASPRDLAHPGARILRVRSFIQEERLRHPWIVGPVTCVETIKALLGVRAFFLWTPKQLHDYVLARRCRLGARDEISQEAESHR